MVDSFQNNPKEDGKGSIEKVESFKKANIKISPSILNIPLEKIGESIREIENETDYIHIDVMDGTFVSNTTNGVAMFQRAKEVSSKPLDVHLMVANPIEEVEKYQGAEIITFHIEAITAVNRERKVRKLIDKIRSLHAKVGISVKPNTPVTEIKMWLEQIDLVLIMTVEPGYGGQKLIPQTLEKVKELRDLGYQKLIEVDGGIHLKNSEMVKATPVDIIVAGTAIFSAENKREAVRKIKS